MPKAWQDAIEASSERFEISVALTSVNAATNASHTFASFSLDRQTAKEVVVQAIKMLELIAAEMS